MNVAVGRLHLSIWMADTLRRDCIPVAPDAADMLEQAFKADQRHRAVEEDKRRWAADHPLRGSVR